MEDYFYFEAPYGIIGKLASWIYLTNYLTKLLKNSNRVIKEYVEAASGDKF